jgi:hypothetical protein
VGTSLTWIAIPLTAAASSALAVLAGASIQVVLACAALGAALAAAVRAYAGASLGAALASSCAGVLGVLGVLDLGDADLAREAASAAAALFAVTELVRALPVKSSPWPGVAAAVAAAALAPAYVGVAAITFVRVATGPWRRPRGAVVMPLIGMAACALAAVAALARGGALASLWLAWQGPERGPGAPMLRVLVLAGDSIGPLAIVAAASGMIAGAARGRVAAVVLLMLVAGALAVDLRVGAITAATPVAAALAAGLGLARVAALVRHPIGQAAVGATVGFVLLVAPMWAVVVRW